MLSVFFRNKFLKGFVLSQILQDLCENGPLANWGPPRAASIQQSGPRGAVQHDRLACRAHPRPLGATHRRNDRGVA